MAQTWKESSFGSPYSHYSGSINICNDSVAWSWASGDNPYDPDTYRYTTISRTINGGLDWIPVTFPSQSKNYMRSIFGLNSQEAWITYLDFELGNKVQKTKDGGQTWQLNYLNVNVYVKFIHMWNNLEGIVVGNPDSLGIFEIYKTYDGGSSWEKIMNAPHSISEEAIWIDTYKVLRNELWLATSKSRIFHSIDRGSTWKLIAGPVINSHLEITSLEATEDKKIYLVYYSFGDPYSLGHSSISRSSNSGQTWENVTLPNNSSYVRDICAVPGTNVLVTTHGSDMTNGTSISYDEGESWLEIDTVAKANFLSFYNDETGYATDLLSHTIGSFPTVIYKYSGSPLTGLLNNEQPLDAEFTITPNPTMGDAEIKLTSNSPKDYWILINSLSGNLIRKIILNQVSEINYTVELKTLPPGTYVVTIANKYGSRSEKIIKL